MDNQLSMDEVFISNLINIIEVNLENEQFSAKDLAKKIGLSRSQLYRKLKLLKGKSISQFIREHRLKLALKLLQKNVGTASEVAYRVGFASPTYFNFCFRKFYGFTPGEVKFKFTEHINSKENNQSLNLSPVLYPIKENTPIQRKNYLPKLMMIASINLLFAIMFSYYVHPKSNTSSFSSVKSMAIISDIDFRINPHSTQFNQSFTTDITDGFSIIKGLNIISIPQVSNNGSNKDQKKVKKEKQNVSNLLYLKLRRKKDTIHVTARLIERSNKKQLWINEYHWEINDLFYLRNEIVKQVTSKLKIPITPDELKKIEKLHTKNLTSYLNYFYGKSMFGQNFEEFPNPNLSFTRFKQAIKNDPEYALAYSALANSYLAMVGRGYTDTKIGIDKAIELASKSIDLDFDNPEPHIILGRIAYQFNWDWNMAEREFKFAIKSDPNNALAHLYYANYLYFIKGQTDKSREHIDQVFVINPNLYLGYLFSAKFYFSQGSYNKALKEIEKAKKIFNNYTFANWIKFESYLLQNKHSLAIYEFQKIMNSDPSSRKYTPVLNKIYRKSGIHGIFKWLIELEKNKKESARPYYLAKYHAYLREDDIALTFLEEAYNEQSMHLMEIKNNPFFKNLQSQPRFISILNKMGIQY